MSRIVFPQFQGLRIQSVAFFIFLRILALESTIFAGLLTQIFNHFEEVNILNTSLISIDYGPPISTFRILGVTTRLCSANQKLSQNLTERAKMHLLQ